MRDDGEYLFLEKNEPAKVPETVRQAGSPWKRVAFVCLFFFNGKWTEYPAEAVPVPQGKKSDQNPTGLGKRNLCQLLLF